MEIYYERDFTSKQREKAAKSGAALPDGSFPIESKKDLENAIQAIGRAKDPAKAKAHIKSRAKALGCTDCIPDTWESWQSVANGELVSEATFTRSDSHDGLRNKLSQAIDGKVQAGEDMDGDGDDDSKEREQNGWPLHYVHDVHDKHVIYGMNGKHFAQKYEKDDEGDPHLKGSPVEVEPSYTTVDNSKEAFAESTAFEPSVSNNKVEALCEAFSDKGEITFTVIKPGWSKNNRYYPATLLKNRANIFEGAKMFVDHATEAQDRARPEGSVRDWVANVTKTWAEADGTIKASAKIIDPQFKAKLSTLGESNMLNTMGVSIRAMGESKEGEAEGRKGKIVESLLAAKSVDFVTFAGAGGQVESLL
jgi:hypothetical protein